MRVALARQVPSIHAALHGAPPPDPPNMHGNDFADVIVVQILLNANRSRKKAAQPALLEGLPEGPTREKLAVVLPRAAGCSARRRRRGQGRRG